jgi:hypothetical protein
MRKVKTKTIIYFILLARTRSVCHLDSTSRQENGNSKESTSASLIYFLTLGSAWVRNPHVVFFLPTTARWGKTSYLCKIVLLITWKATGRHIHTDMAAACSKTGGRSCDFAHRCNILIDNSRCRCHVRQSCWPHATNRAQLSLRGRSTSRPELARTQGWPSR